MLFEQMLLKWMFSKQMLLGQILARENAFGTNVVTINVRKNVNWANLDKTSDARTRILKILVELNVSDQKILRSIISRTNAGRTKVWAIAIRPDVIITNTVM